MQCNINNTEYIHSVEFFNFWRDFVLNSTNPVAVLHKFVVDKRSDETSSFYVYDKAQILFYICET